MTITVICFILLAVALLVVTSSTPSVAVVRALAISVIVLAVVYMAGLIR